MKTRVVFLAAALVPMLLASGVEGVAAAEKIPEAFFKDADTIVLDDIERVRYNPDGTYRSEGEMRVLIVTERGRKSESTQSLRFSRRYGTGRFTEISVTGADGVKRQIDVEASARESTDNSSMNANIVDPLDRKLVCNVPGLEKGDVLTVKTLRETTRSRVENEFADAFVFEGLQPCVRSYYEVTAPAARPIRKKTVRNGVGNVVSSERLLDDGSTVHVFAATNTPRMFPEPDMPQIWTQCRHVLVSTVQDWHGFSRWYWDLSLPHIEKTTPAITNTVRNLKSAEAIFRFVSQQIRYMGLTMEDTSPGYAPHDVSVTFENRYGVCRDKAALLVAMLRIAGYKAFPVLINVGAKLDSSVPLPFFNHAIVALEKSDGSIQLMDPTNENTKDMMPAYLSNLSYLVARPEGDVLRVSGVPDPAENSVTAESTARLLQDGSLYFSTDISYTGINDTLYRGAFARFTDKEAADFFERSLRVLSPAAELVDYSISPSDVRDTTKPLRVSIKGKLRGMTVDGTDYIEVRRPFITRGMGIIGMILRGNTALEKRKYPLVVDTTAQVSERLVMELGESVGDVVSLPPGGKHGEGYVFETSCRVNGGRLEATRVLQLEKLEFSPAQYVRLKESLKEYEASTRRRCLFRRNKLGNADSRLVSSTCQVHTLDDFNWVETNTVEREILTYKGLKSFSEFKLEYHPSVSTVEVLEATVSNRNGRVFSATDKECNTMDASWAAAAPRYPAGKMLVVNLPGVEVGSVIRLKTATRVKSSPLPLFVHRYLDRFEPAGRISVSVDGEVKESSSPVRLRREMHLPRGVLWRDSAVFSRCRWPVFMEKMRKAAVVEPCARVKGTVREIRDFMARNVRIAGPSLYDLPVELQVTSPERVLAERYASRLDYIRTMASLLLASGHEASVVFAESSNSFTAEERRLNKQVYPNPSVYSTAYCRVRSAAGDVFIGTENQYSPVGASGAQGAEFFDPVAGSFGVVTVPCGMSDSSEKLIECELEGNGDALVKKTELFHGAGVGVFRKLYTEMLPEDRRRHFMGLVDDIATGAEARGDLETDTEAYPARRAFACLVPDYASIDGGVMSVELPKREIPIPAFSGEERAAPVAVYAADRSEETYVYRFPAGFKMVEHVPEDVVIKYPGTDDEWVSFTYKVSLEGERVVVRVKRIVNARPADALDADLAALLRVWRDRLHSRKQNSISVMR